MRKESDPSVLGGNSSPLDVPVEQGERLSEGATVTKKTGTFGGQTSVKLVALGLVAVVSLVAGCTLASSPDFYSWVVDSLEEKQKDVLLMIGATTAAAAATTGFQSISNMLVGLDSGFAVVYATIMLEKYLFVAITKALFFVFVPVGCVLKILRFLLGVEGLGELGNKLLVFGVSLFIAIPCSLWVSDVVEDAYASTMGASAASVQQVDSATSSDNEAAAAAVESADADDATTNGDWIAGVADSIGSAVSGLVNDAGEAIGNAANEIQTQLNQLIETLALLIVTTCVIPLLVFLFFLWLIKVVLGVDLSMPAALKGRFGNKQK